MLLSAMALGWISQQTPKPTFPDPTRSAWIVSWNPECLKALKSRRAKLSEILPGWMTIQADGSVKYAYGVTPEFRAEVRKITAGKIRLLGMINNYGENGFESTRITKMLATPASRKKHIDQLLHFIKADKLDGIDLDYESLKEADVDRYSAFVRELKAAMGKKHLSVTVHAKETDKVGWEAPNAHDWKALGAAADSFRIMAYDFHWDTSEPGPIAPNDWVERVIKYALTRVPRSKLRLGVAGYGYDWSRKPALSLTINQFDRREAVMHLMSGELMKDKVYFSGSQAMWAKHGIAKKYGIPGITIWYLGSDDPEFWNR